MSKKAQPWKKISGKMILDHPLMKINEDIVLLPDGKKSTYVLQAPSDTNSVIIIALNKQGELLVQKEYNYPTDTIMWQLPGGSTNAGEDIKQAALRELAEESGYSAKSAKIVGFYYGHNRTTNKKQYVIECKELFKAKLQEDHDEFIESYWLSSAKIDKMIKHDEINNINLIAAVNLWRTKIMGDKGYG